VRLRHACSLRRHERHDSAARVCTSEHWENCFSSPLIRRFVANHRDGPVPTRNSAGVHKISAHVPAHAAKSCYLQQVFVPLWNRRFRREPQLAGDAHRAVRPETNLDSVLSIRQSRTVGQDHTVRWEGVIYRIERKQIQAAMRGARVQLERGLDGSTWMHWRKRVLALELCPAPSRRRVEPPVLQRRATAMRSAKEKARARQRFLDNRRRWRENYNHLPHRPLWQAIRDSPSRAEVT